MPFLIRNIKPNRQPVVVRHEGELIELAHTEQVVLDIRNITSEMFLQSMRGEITTLFVGRMPITQKEGDVQETQIVAEGEIEPEVVKEITKPVVKKTKPAIS